MENKQTFKLPEYLGLGTLDQDSVIRTRRGVTATYSVKGDLLYKVKCTPKKCRLEEYFAEKLFFVMDKKTFKQAFFSLMALSCTHVSPRLEALSNKICESLNISICYPQGEFGHGYYPSGLVLRLRHPIIQSNAQAWKKLKARLISDPSISNLYDSEQEGLIFKINGDYTVSVEEVTLVDFQCNLFQLVEAVDYLVKSQIIPEPQEYCFSIVESSLLKQCGMQVFAPYNGSGCKAAGVVRDEAMKLNPQKDVINIVNFLKQHADDPGEKITWFIADLAAKGGGKFT